MKEELVSGCKRILIYILNEKRHIEKIKKETSSDKKRKKKNYVNKDEVIFINKIVEKTGLNKKKVSPILIPFLEDCKLLTITKDKELHKQMKFVDLTDVGNGISSFFEDIEKFDKSFEDYLKTFKDKLEKYEEKLEERGRQPDALNYKLNQVHETMEKYGLLPFKNSNTEDTVLDNELYNIDDNNNNIDEDDPTNYQENFDKFKSNLLDSAGFNEDEKKCFMIG